MPDLLGSLRERLSLIEKPRPWLAEVAEKYHYMHKAVHRRASPFGWAVTLDGGETHADGAPFGFIVFSTIHFIKMAGEFGYAGLPTKWQVLCLSRLWLHDDLPHNSETCVIAKALKLVQRRWIDVHPPRFPEQPYHIVKVISYADGNFHKGTIYRAANFRELPPIQVKERDAGTRGKGVQGGTLYRFVYDLAEPRWKYEPPPLVQLALLSEKELA